MIETIIVVALIFLFWLLNARKKEKNPRAEKKKSNEETKKQKPEEREQKHKRPDYETLFIKNSEVTTAQGKHVYIRNDFHDHILKIIHVIGKNEISIFSYIDNVMMHHFDEFQEEIIKSYKENNKDIF